MGILSLIHSMCVQIPLFSMMILTIFILGLWISQSNSVVACTWFSHDRAYWKRIKEWIGSLCGCTHSVSRGSAETKGNFLPFYFVWDLINFYFSYAFRIRQEIQEVVDGEYPQDDNVIVNAPHPQTVSVCNHLHKSPSVFIYLLSQYVSLAV